MSQISYVHTDEFFIQRFTLKKPQAHMHYHHSYELYYVIEGERDYFVGDKFFKAAKGDLVWIPQNMLHRTDGKGATRILMFVKREYLERYFQPKLIEELVYDEPFIFHADAISDERLNRIFSKLLTEQSKESERSELTIISQLFEVLYMLRFSENHYIPPVSEDKRISGIVKYINENYMSISNIDEIAGQFFITKYHLCHIFKENLGVSLISYLNTIRVRAACELLKTKEYKLAEIATRSGFNSIPYFCKVFKDEKGVSPTEYRKNSR